MGRERGVLVEAEAAFFEGDELLVADDDVVEDLDVEEFAGGDELAGDMNVFGGGGGVAGGVVVGDDDGGGVVAEGGAEEFADAEDGAVEATDVDGGGVEDAVAGIEEEEAEVFLFEEGHFGHEEVGGVDGGGDAGAVEGGDEEGAAAEFEGGFNFDRFDLADAVDAHQFVDGGAGESGGVFEFGEELLGEGEDVALAAAGAEHDGEEFAGGEGAFADAEEAFAGAFLLGEIV